MGKKKKKEKKKKVVEEVKEIEDIQGYSLDDALHSTKTTKTTLQSLMEEVNEGKGFELPKKEGEEKITPHLSHESRSKIAEAYALEDVPLAKRKTSQKREKILVTSETKDKVKPSVAKEKSKPASRPKIQVEASTVPTLGEKESLGVKEEFAPKPPKKRAQPSIKKDNIYAKLTVFFEDLLKSYNERYERWENSISNILGILRKMRKITKKNTDDLVVSINNQYKKIQADLELFKIKRNEVEKVAEVDIESMSGKFKRVLGLLELQIKEYQLKRVTDDLIHEMKY
ncbi:MAG: hypothetical protein ACFFG0_29065 [Candidatus Thorarchaeota archaeon]